MCLLFSLNEGSPVQLVKALFVFLFSGSLTIAFLRAGKPVIVILLLSIKTFEFSSTFSHLKELFECLILECFFSPHGTYLVTSENAASSPKT